MAPAQTTTPKNALVFVPAPGIGHLVSVMEFAKRLLERDDSFSITMLLMSPPFAHDVTTYVEKLNASHPEFQFLGLPSVAPPPLEDVLACPEHFVSVFIADHKNHVKDMIVNHVLSNKSVKLAGLVLDLFCTAFVDVAKDLGVPSYIFFASGAAFLGSMLYLPDRFDKGGVTYKPTDPDSIIPSYINPVPSRVLPSLLFHDGGYSTFVSHARKFKEAKGIIVNTFAELESHAVNYLNGEADVPHVYTVGPVVDHKGNSPVADGNQREEIMNWLDAQPQKSVVFLCFGSQGSFGVPQLKEIALGLEQSGQRFLWSIRRPPSQESLNPGEVNDFSELLPEGFLGRTKDVGFICGWAPQVEVLAHKATGAFVSHCGWNSILESTWYGVPVVTWPLYGEQQINAFQLVKDAGVAIEMKMDYRKDGGEVVKADQVAKAVKDVIEGASDVKSKVKAMSETGRKALLEGGSSYVAFETLVGVLSGNKA
ncbi:anthocyanidin 3-O-glucosyltransferase 2-like [Populus nigra]|uniref:anthocyanidin 3-O-glucosyltransferase 2-like n=1 Tax=Populus nigra TaxID=3691 RepID=UPI002B276A0F|nr:anthocyanidin 3-O-glucosyltransferase 2-like [Populus nigra]